MKLKIIITGSKVHDVGYRYFLLGGARRHHLPGFSADNLTGKEQEVEVLLEGKDAQVKAFVDFVRNNKPDNAIVSDIATSDYDDEVQRRSEYVQDITAMQMLKAIPAILEIKKGIEGIKEDTGEIPQIAKNTKETLEEVKGIRQDQPSFAMQLRQLQQDVVAIKAQLKMP